MSIDAGDKVFYYMTRDSLVFLTLAENRYPKRLAFLYLDEVCMLCRDECVSRCHYDCDLPHLPLFPKETSYQLCCNDGSSLSFVR
jgi:ferredoxin